MFLADSKPPYEQPAKLAETPPPEEFPRFGQGCSERGSFNGRLTVPDELFVKQLSAMTVRKPPRERCVMSAQSDAVVRLAG